MQVCTRGTPGDDRLDVRHSASTGQARFLRLVGTGTGCLFTVPAGGAAALSGAHRRQRQHSRPIDHRPPKSNVPLFPLYRSHARVTTGTRTMLPAPTLLHSGAVAREKLRTTPRRSSHNGRNPRNRMSTAPGLRRRRLPHTGRGHVDTGHAWLCLSTPAPPLPRTLSTATSYGGPGLRRALVSRIPVNLPLSTKRHSQARGAPSAAVWL